MGNETNNNFSRYIVPKDPRSVRFQEATTRQNFGTIDLSVMGLDILIQYAPGTGNAPNTTPVEVAPTTGVYEIPSTVKPLETTISELQHQGAKMVILSPGYNIQHNEAEGLGFRRAASTRTETPVYFRTF